jgi:hypothetical protein
MHRSGAAGVGAALAAGASATEVAAAGVPSLVNLAVDAWRSLQRRRVQKWWESVLNTDEDSAQLAARIAAGLVEEQDTVVQGVIGGARAASEAIDLAAVPVIAAMSRMFFDAQVPRWFYRAGVDMVSNLAADELLGLRLFSDAVSSLKSPFVKLRAEPFSPDSPSKLIHEDPSADVGRHRLDQDTKAVLAEDNMRPIATILHAPRIFSEFRRSMLVEEHPTGFFDNVSGRNILIIDIRIARWFRLPYPCSGLGPRTRQETRSESQRAIWSTYGALARR